MVKHFRTKKVPIAWALWVGIMKNKLGRVMNDDLFVEEDNYSGDFKDFLIGDEKISVNMNRGV